MTKTSNRKEFDLEKRTTFFAKNVIKLCKKLGRDPINDRLIGQLTRSSGSIGANYREANDALGKKDFQHKVKIARKETKETIHWLEITEEANKDFNDEVSILFKEATELRNIFSAILNNCK